MPKGRKDFEEQYDHSTGSFFNLCKRSHISQYPNIVLKFWTLAHVYSLEFNDIAF